MTIENLLELVDSLSPNTCSREQKLYWYNLCESMLYEKAKKSYRYLETTITGGVVKLPDGYSSEDVEVIYVNGKAMDKLDLRSGLPAKKEGTQNIGVVLKERHFEVKTSEFEGDIFFNGDAITMAGHNFNTGDKLMIESPVFTGDVTVMGISGDTLFVNKPFEINDCFGKAVKSLDIEVMARAPYDKLYIDYILAQIDYYNKDYEGYNNNSYLFNELLDEYIRKNTQSSPGAKHKQIKNLW